MRIRGLLLFQVRILMIAIILKSMVLTKHILIILKLIYVLQGIL